MTASSPNTSCDEPECLPPTTGLLRAANCPTPRVLADRERTRRCRYALQPGWRRPSDALFWMWSDAPDTGYALVSGGLRARPRPAQNAMRMALRSVISDANRTDRGASPFPLRILEFRRSLQHPEIT